MKLVYKILLIVLTCGSFVGCSDDTPPLGDVEGTVLLDGKPFDNGSLVFTPVSGGRPSVATTDEEGHFEAYYVKNKTGALVGKHKVSFEVSSEPASSEEQFMPPAGARRGPKSYSVSPAEIDVQEGYNEIEFEVKSK